MSLRCKDDAKLGNQIIGTKYANPWTVLVSMTNQKALSFVHVLRVSLAAGPCSLGSGSRPRTKGMTGSRRIKRAMERILRVIDGLCLRRRNGRMMGRRSPPAAFPAKITPFASPRRSTNHSDMYDMHGAYNKANELLSPQLRNDADVTAYIPRSHTQLLARGRVSISRSHSSLQTSSQNRQTFPRTCSCVGVGDIER